MSDVGKIGWIDLTVADATAFDPHMWVNGPDSCALVYTDDNYDCSFPPPTYQCPSAEVEGLTAGETYQVVVASYGDCSAEDVEYELRVDGGPAELAIDDAAAGYAYTIDIVGSGTITNE